MFASRSIALHYAPRRQRRSLLDYLGLYQQRRDLAALSDAQLRDIGVSREEALNEADRPVWSAPNHWIK